MYHFQTIMTLGDIGNKMPILIANRDEANKLLIGTGELKLKDLKRGAPPPPPSL